MKGKRAKQEGRRVAEAQASDPAMQEEAQAQAPPAVPPEPQPSEAGADARPEAGSAAGAAGLVEPPEEAVRRLQEELDQYKDQLLRTAADFDNFRKRVARERGEIWSRAQAQLATSLLDALDDLIRVAHVDPVTATPHDIMAGVGLVERKLFRELEQAGLERVGAPGERFDPALHEAVGALPAPAPEKEGEIADVIQIGYRFGPALLRPARVRVYVGGASGDGGPPVAQAGPAGDPGGGEPQT